MPGSDTAALTGSAKAFEAHRLLNDTTAPYPDDRGIAALFEDCARRRADAVAVVHGERRVTYRELDRMADGLAARLRAHGTVPGDAIAVCADRSPELIAALLAALKCGAAYVPVSDTWPEARLRTLFDRAGCRLLLTDRAEDAAPHVPGTTRVSTHDAAADAPAQRPDSADGPDAVAYVNFTSGSTGQPKGVPIHHRSVARLVFGATYAPLNQDTVTLQLAPVTFDAATFEVWGALLHGGTCVLYPDDFIRFSRLRRTLEDERVTVLFLTTALFNSLLDDAPQTLDRVPHVLTGGEAHSLKHIARALERYGPGRVSSVYGPTEATTFATHYPIDALAPGESALPIGRPIQNTRAYVVDGERLCDPGEIGEVLLAGPGLSPGYLGLPEENARRFVSFAVDGAAERLYRTGDRAYLRSDGELVFQGRSDDQVKINGFRIELGEIAHHIDRHPDVKQGYVTTADEPGGRRVLIAYVVPANERCSPDTVRAHLERSLPSYMVPRSISLCDGLPLTPTGKVDRRALLSLTELEQT